MQLLILKLQVVIEEIARRVCSRGHFGAPDDRWEQTIGTDEHLKIYNSAGHHQTGQVISTQNTHGMFTYCVHTSLRKWKALGLCKKFLSTDIDLSSPYNVSKGRGQSVILARTYDQEIRPIDSKILDFNISLCKKEFTFPPIFLQLRSRIICMGKIFKKYPCRDREEFWCAQGLSLDPHLSQVDSKLDTVKRTTNWYWVEPGEEKLNSDSNTEGIETKMCRSNLL